jgi:hypothetical protein
MTIRWLVELLLWLARSPHVSAYGLRSTSAAWSDSGV